MQPRRRKSSSTRTAYIIPQSVATALPHIRRATAHRQQYQQMVSLSIRESITDGIVIISGLHDKSQLEFIREHTGERHLHLALVSPLDVELSNTTLYLADTVSEAVSKVLDASDAKIAELVIDTDASAVLDLVKDRIVAGTSLVFPEKEVDAGARWLWKHKHVFYAMSKARAGGYVLLVATWRAN